jgi:hypothetical protein
MGDIFGTITPPGPFPGDPRNEIGRLVGFGVRMAILVAGIFLLIYLFWGAFDWITSGGEKEKLSKAQQKLTQAVIGIILIFGAIALFGLITGDILGIIQKDAGGNWIFKIPTL